MGGGQGAEEPDDDEDLFGDTDAAAPREPRGATVPSGLQAKPGGSYFGDRRDDMADLAPLHTATGKWCPCFPAPSL